MKGMRVLEFGWSEMERAWGGIVMRFSLCILRVLGIEDEVSITHGFFGSMAQMGNEHNDAKREVDTTHQGSAHPPYN